MTELSQAVASLDAKKRELLALLARQKGIDPARAAILPRPRTAEDHPASFAQERLWFLDRLRPGDPAYNLPLTHSFRGALPPEALRSALAEVIRRHEILRTRFRERDGRPVQVILPPAPAPAPAKTEGVELPLIDLSALPEARGLSEVHRLHAEEARHPFDLERGPLLRTRLVRLAADSHALISNLHHIVADGWSLGVMSRELMTLYLHRAWGRPISPALPELPVQYADYAAWQREWLSGETLERHLEYWRRQLAGSPPVVDLPADHPRPAGGAARGRRLHLALPAGTAEGIAALGRRTGTTLFMVLLAVFAALLRRVAGIVDLPIGTPVAGRSRRELEPLIGLFVNSLVLRLDLSGDPTFEELLGRVQRVAVDAFAHQDLPFEKLVEELRPERALNRQPLFQVMFVLQNTPDAPVVEGGAGDALETEQPAADLDLSLTCQESGGSLTAEIEYSLELFDPPTIRRLGRQLEALLAGVAEDSARRLSGLPLLAEEERHQLLVEWSGGPAAVPPPCLQCLQGAVAARAAERPDAVALVAGVDGIDGVDGVDGVNTGLHLTYGELSRRAAGLARHLRRLGIRSEDRVALGIERSAEAVVGLLGVLESGGACVPLDPSHPAERLAGMLADSGASILLIGSGPAPSWAAAERGPRIVALAGLGMEAGEPDSVPAPVSPRQAACVLYTSGSTGRPKGVVLEHRSLAGYALEAAEFYGLRADDRCLQFAALSFDAAVEEIFSCFAAGGTLVLRAGSMLDSPRRFLAELERLEITFADLPTAYWHELASGLAEALPAALRLVVLGGERALAEQLVLWRQIPGASRVRLINTYGPAETTIASTRAEIGTAGPAALADVPIGGPIPGARVYAVDSLGGDGLLLPRGSAGELWIGGSCVSRGYLGRPDATAAVFVPDPFGDEPGGRLYRTGDRVRWRAGGMLEFLGRIDGQIKIRGFRVEPGEVEDALARHPGVRAAAVVVQGEVGGSPRLVACVVAADAERAPDVDAAALRRFLAGTLPEPMLPAAFVFLPELPLNPHGKVDRRALAQQAAAGKDSVPDREITAPRTPAEEELAGIWAELLGIAQVGVHDGFFELGGHSLLASRLVSRVRAAFGVELALRTVFEEPTVAALAVHVERLQGGGPASAPALVPVPRKAGPSGDPELPLSFAQQRLWFLERLAPGAAYNVPAAFRLRGALDPQALENALTAVVARHEVLRTTFHLSRADLPSQTKGVDANFGIAREAGGALSRASARGRDGEGSSASAGEDPSPALPRFAGEGAPALPMAPMGDGEPVQRIAPPWTFRLPLVDLEGVGEEEARRLAAAEALRPFDLEKGPVIRAVLLRLGPEDHALLATMHHIASDGWSVEVMIAEVAALYGGGTLSPLPVQYGDYAVWQRSWLTGEVLESELRFWRDALAGAPAVLELPADRARPAIPSGRGGLKALALPAGLRDALAALGRSTGASLFMVLLAAWKTLLFRVTGQTDLPVGTVVAGRGRIEIERLIGFFVNTLVLRTDLGAGGLEGPSFREAVARVRHTALAAFAHQELPFERLVQELAPERSLAHAPLFQVSFSLESTAGVGGGEPLPGLDLSLFGGPGGDAEERAAKFDLSLAVSDQGAGLAAFLEFSRDLFDATTAQRLLEGWVRLLEGAAAAPEARLAELPLLSESELHQTVFEWNDLGGAHTGDRCLHELVEEQAARTPHAPALISENREVSYRQLDEAANRLARALHGIGGIAPEVPVAVHAERSIEMIVAILAVWKAGGAYVPLEPAYPAERLAYLLEDSGAPVVLTQESLRDALPIRPGLRALSIEEYLEGESEGRLEPWALPDNLACILYTSGSTGRPKGVALRHRGLVRRLLWAQDGLYHLEAAEASLFKASFSFDFSLWEMFGPLLAGARIVIVRPGGQQDPSYLARLLRERDVKTVQFVPSLLDLFLREPGIEEIRGLRQVVSGGEALTADLRDRFFSRFEHGVALHNQYGPTEISIDTTLWTCAPDRDRERVPIGRPILNRIHLLDRSLRLVPVGAAGELHVAGLGLARGYLGRPALTAERFVPSPWGGVGEGGERLYNTRDLARWRPDGALEYLGRSDEQVKVRGIRIEPGEIEAVLRQHPDVETAAVVAGKDGAGSTRLIAFFVAAPGSTLTAAELRSHLRAHLPEVLLPASLRRLDALPLTTGGKVDRQALARLEAAAPEIGEAGAPPRTPAEEVLAGIWHELLGGSIGVHDNFFERGGHSLLAARLVARVRSVFEVELPLRAVFEEPTVAALAARIAILQRDGGEAPRPPLLPVPRPVGDSGEPELPLSFAQQRLWFLERLAPGPAYNIPVALRLRGRLDIPALEASLSEAVARHEVLRTTFHARPAEPVQRISRPHPFPLPRIDLAGIALPEAEREARRLAGEESLRPFDLETGPVIRGLLLRLGAEDHAACLTMHHISSDGWSIEVLTGEMSALYAAFASGAPSPLPALPVQYGDYAVWQRGWLTAEVLEGQLRFWRQALAGAPAVLELPADRPRPALPSGRGGVRSALLPASLVEPLAALGRRAGASLFMVLLAGFKALLRHLTGQSDLPVGTVVAGRDRIEIERLIGFFVNTLVLRTDLGADRPEGPSFEDAVIRVRSATLAAFAHQDVPFERLVEELAPVRSLAHSPLFQVEFSLQSAAGIGDIGSGGLVLPGLALSALGGLSEDLPAKFDLSLTMTEAGSGLAASLEFNRDLFDATTAERLLGSFARLLQSAALQPANRLGELAVLSGSERHQLLTEWSGGTEKISGGLLHERFEAQARRDPARIALVCGEERLTYGDLAQRAGLLAHRLRELGVGPESRVALCFERSPEMIVSLLAVLMAGGAYVPLDPAYPEERLAFLLEDSGAEVLLTVEALAARLVAGVRVRIVCLDREADGRGLPPPPSSWGTGESLAYLIYTSGSTGRPKGVMVTHGQASRLFDATRRWFGFGPDDVWTLFHSYAFDFSVWEIWGALLHGGRLVVVPHLVSRSPEDFHRLLVREQVTVLNQTPSAFLQLLQAEEAASEEERSRLALRHVIFGGEALDPASLAPWVRRHGDEHPRLVNMYGITETTVHVTCQPLTASEIAAGGSRIGRPIPDLRVHLLANGMRPVPIGAPGEIFVGGAGVARGYLGQTDRTAERFVPDPFGGDGERLYRSGDRARRRPDGSLEFLGRIDGQVKIRGFRIEPGEIEAALARHPGVAQAAVVTEDFRLIAYVTVRRDHEAPPAELRRFLGARLPEHMIPAAFVTLPELPLTAHGKVDRAALARAAAGLPAGGERTVESLRTPVEEVLAGIWSEVLGVAAIGPDDDFFQLSGHSLLATQVVYRARQAFGVDLPLRRLFEGATLAELAAEIEQAARAGQGGPGAPEVPRLERLPAERKAGRLPTTLTQAWVWNLQGGPVSSQLNLPLAFRVRGEFDLPALHGGFVEIVRRHESLRLIFQEEGGEIFAELVPFIPPPMPLVDLSGLPDAPREAALVLLARQDAGREFDLTRGPLVTALVLRLAERDHALLFNVHHIVSDGWSLEVFQRELAALYGALARRQAPALPPLPVQLTDYAVWQRRAVSGDALATQLAHWQKRLEGSRPLELPTRRPRPADFGGLTVASGRLLTGEKEAELRAFARSAGGTVSMLLLAGYFGILHRYSGRDDLVVLSVFSGRSRPELTGMIGLFVSTVALRVDLSGSPGFRELLARVREAVLTAYTHSDVPYAKVLAAVAPDDRFNRMALSRTLFNMLSFPAAPSSGAPGAAGPDLALEELAVGETHARYDLILEGQEGAGFLQYLWIAAADLFSPEDLADLRADFETLLAGAIAEPDAPLDRLLPIPRYLRDASQGDELR